MISSDQVRKILKTEYYDIDQAFEDKNRAEKYLQKKLVIKMENLNYYVREVD